MAYNILKCAKPHSLQHKCKLKLQQDTFFSLPERKYQKVWEHSMLACGCSNRCSYIILC